MFKGRIEYNLESQDKALANGVLFCRVNPGKLAEVNVYHEVLHMFGREISYMNACSDTSTCRECLAWQTLSLWVRKSKSVFGIITRPKCESLCLNIHHYSTEGYIRHSTGPVVSCPLYWWFISRQSDPYPRRVLVPLFNCMKSERCSLG